MIRWMCGIKLNERKKSLQCKASIVALNQRSIIGLIFTTLSQDLT